MKVTFRQVGGFVPMAFGCTVDAGGLDPAEAAQLRSLVDGAGFWTLTDARLARAADVPVVSITVDDEARSHSVVFSLIRVPDVAQPLVQFLRARSRNLLDELRADRSE